MKREISTHREEVPKVVERPAAQAAAIERLASGATAVDAAAAAGVGRTTLYRWLNDDAAFQAAYNAWQADVIANARGRLLALTEAAVTTVAKAVRRGDARTAMVVLQKQGLLAPSVPGSTDPGQVARDAAVRRARRERALVDDECSAAPEVFDPMRLMGDVPMCLPDPTATAPARKPT